MPELNQRGAKLVDVARLAECSPATVSRVLNGNPTVGKNERERVLKAAEELGYVPNGSARALRSTRTRLVGAIIPTLDHAIYAIMVDGLQDRLSEKGVSLIINTSAYDLDLEYEQAKLLMERGVETIVLVGGDHKPETLALLEQKRCGYVFTYTCSANPTGGAIGFDNEKAGATAADYLYSLGHRHFGMIAGVTKDNDRARDRRDGFVDALLTLGVPPNQINTVEARYDVDSGKLAMQSLFQSTVHPTAVFCGSDILAAGALKLCQSRGIRVPEDISIVGFDNLEIAKLTTPDLTTLEVPAREMGSLAGEYALANERERALLRERELDIRLIVRNSSGTAPKGLQNSIVHDK